MTGPGKIAQSRSAKAGNNLPICTSKLPGNPLLPANSRLASNRSRFGPPADSGAIFLDRDGVVVADVHYLTEPAQLDVLPGVTEALRVLRQQFFIIVVTNQSGIARGLLTEDELRTIHTELDHRLATEDALVDAFYYCPHLPSGQVTAYDLTCDCRKPAPGMIFRARDDWGIDLDRSFMIGDMPSDMEAAKAAGVKGILTGEQTTVPSDWCLGAEDLLEAAHIISAVTSQLEEGGAKETQGVFGARSPRQYRRRTV